MNISKNPSAIRSQKEITNALLFLMKKSPYEEITVKQVILEARVSRKTFYRNFSSKEDVLISYLHAVITSYTDKLLSLKTLTLSGILDVIFDTCEAHQSLLQILLSNNLQYLLLYELNLALPIIHRQIVSADNPLFSGIPEKTVDYIIYFNIGAVYNILMKWLENGCLENPADIKEALLQYLTKNVLCTFSC